MKGLVDGLSLYLNNNQTGDYSRSIYNNLIKYSSMDINILRDYEIKSKLYEHNEVELLLDRNNNNFMNLSRHLSNNNYSFYHCLNNGFSFPEEMDFNYIMSISTLLPFYYEEFCNDKYIQNFFTKFPYSVLKSKNIVCPSYSSKKSFCENFSICENNIIINYGVISDFFLPLDKYMSSIYLKSKFKIDYDFIIFYGDFNRVKSLEQTIFIFSQLKKEFSNIIYLICSNSFNDSNYLNELKTIISKLNLQHSVIFLEGLSLLDQANLYNKALFFIDLSLYEDVNLNIVNAYSCGTPIICSSISLYKEYFGDNCFYYNKNLDILSLIKYISNYSLHNDNYVLSKFDKWNSINTSIHIYNQLI